MMLQRLSYSIGYDILCKKVKHIVAWRWVSYITGRKVGNWRRDKKMITFVSYNSQNKSCLSAYY
jgi:hypothetical protein